MNKEGALLKKTVKTILWIAGGLGTVFALWMVLGFPIFFDRLCIVSQDPADSDCIVCVGAGLTSGNLPTDDGWGRIYTAVQLYLDGYGRKIVFTGGGSARISEAEVYAEAARWLGMAETDALLDPGPNQTSEHPRNIQAIPGAGITPSTPLNIVTSELHSKRTALCFKKAGFSSFRLVTGYTATGSRIAEGRVVSRPEAAQFLRSERTSSLPGFRQSGKVYRDIFMRMRARSWRFFTALREIAALAAYKIKGYI